MADQAPPPVDFDLPMDAGPKARSVPDAIPFEVWQARIRQLRQWFPNGIPTAEERWKAKVQVEFHLNPRNDA